MEHILNIFDWLLYIWFAINILYLLVYRYSFHPAGERGAQFPIVINDNKSYTRCDVSDSLIRVQIVGPRDKVAHTHEFPLNRE